MQSKFWDWLNYRIPITKILSLGLDEEIPGGSRFTYVLGSATLGVFLLQVITGTLELFYYVPTTDHAYDSLNYLRTEVPFGWLIHGLHYWGANAFVVIVGLHMLRVFIWGAYKKPREMTWLFGVVLLLITVVMSFTGAALPWDQRGFWAARVGINISGTIPVIGPILKFLISGGSDIGQLTLSRFFIFHAAIFPTLAVLFICFHILAFRKFGSIGPWKESKRKGFAPFWPDQVYKDIIAFLFIVGCLVTLAAFFPPPFAGPADPSDSSYVPKPEWNFLFIYQSLKFFPGSFEILGTFVFPSILILLFFLLPFLDNNVERNPFKRKIVIPAGLIITLGILVLTIDGYLSGENENGGKITIEKEFVYTQSVKDGKNIFTSLGCIGCHSVLGLGGTVGPDLTNELNKNRTADWLRSQLQNPKEHNPNSTMPSYAFLSQDQSTKLISFLLHPIPITPVGSSDVAGGIIDTSVVVKKDSVQKLKIGLAAFIKGSPEYGEDLYNKYCLSCHGVHGKKGIENTGSSEGIVPSINPIAKTFYNNDPAVFAQNIDKIIQHGSLPEGDNPSLKMEAYGDKLVLTQQQISDIEAYILKLNKVERGMLINPGILPETFYTLFIIIILLTIISLVIIRIRSKKPG